MTDEAERDPSLLLQIVALLNEERDKIDAGEIVAIKIWQRDGKLIVRYLGHKVRRLKPPA